MRTINSAIVLMMRGMVFSLRRDFPTEWVSFAKGTGSFNATIRREFFPYFTQSRSIAITRMDVYARDVTKHEKVGDAAAATTDLADKNRLALVFSSPATPLLARSAEDVY
jgi:hypothetical protein